MASKNELTAKERAFVAAYDGAGDGTRAAAAAGYAKPAKVASEVLRRPRVQAALKEKWAANASVVRTEKEGLFAFWTETMLNKQVPIKSRLKASELLGRSIGVFSAEKGQDVPDMVLNVVLPKIQRDAAGE